MRLVVRAAFTLALVSTARPLALAHPVTVDGDLSDWFAAPPLGDNVGRLQRDAASRGEILWVDADDDTRNDLAAGGANEIADLREVRVTSDATSLSFLVDLDGVMDGPSPPMIQIAVDLDRVPGNGARFFDGFSDLRTSEGAAFEWIVRTRSPEGEPVRVDVVSRDYVVSEGAGSVAVDAVNARFEISVPWSAFGLSAAPSAFRLTVATFREDPGTGLAIDLFGPDALDVLTDYDDRPNDLTQFTWPHEINDTDDVVDHFVEVFLAPDGEPRAPVLIARVVSDGTAEWVGLRNVTRAAFDLSGLRLGDEERPGEGEGMYVLSGFSLGAGATGFATLATFGAAFETRYGRAADALLEGTSRLLGWSSGSMALSNTGDEVLLLGADNLIWDVVTYGLARYPGVDGAAPRPAVDQVIARLGADTDVMPTDFVVVPDCAAALACPGGVCQACTDFACLPVTVGTSCADADLCNGDETCDGSGACVAAAALDCDDASACTTDSCVPATGCVNEPVTCADDGNPCTTPVCDPLTGCGFADVVNGTSCDDADACTTATVCTDGTCGAGVAVTCADDGNACTTERCDAALGCLIEAVVDGTDCDDGDACTSGSACLMGSCGGGVAITCVDDDNPCTAPTCDAATGCGLSNVADGTACEDSSACTTSTTCTAGVCGGGSAVECPDDENPCTAPLCDPVSGECGFANVADGVGCDDEDPCTAATTCTAGVCGGGDAVVCADDGNPCTAESCDAITGCRSTAVADGTVCDDADACTSGEACASGVCAGGSAVTCPDDGNPCTVALCTPSTGCGATNAADGMACDDGDPCTEGDECIAGACGGDPVPACMSDAGSMDGGTDDGGTDDGGTDDGGTDDGGIDDGGASEDAAVSVDAGRGDAGGGGAGDGGAGDGGAGDGGASGGGASGGGASGGGGCGCRTDRGGDVRFAWLLVGLLVFSRRRRR